MAKKKNNLTLIKTGSQLTIDSATVICKAIRDALKSKQDIQIETEQIEEIDLAGIQLLTFAQKAAESKGVKLVLKTSYTENIKILLESTGFGQIAVS